MKKWRSKSEEGRNIITRAKNKDERVRSILLIDFIDFYNL